MSLLGNILNAIAGRGAKVTSCIKHAEAGDASAQFYLGFFYERGQYGIPQDYCESAKWYRRAAEQGHAGAQLYLGMYIAQGRGLEEDFVEAYKWIELAKGGGALDKTAAIAAQNEIIPLMTDKQIADGKRLARIFMPTQFKKS